MTLLLNPHEYDHGHDHDGGVDDHGRDDDGHEHGHGHGHGVKSLSAVLKSSFFLLRSASVCLDSRVRVRNRSRKTRNWYREEIKMKNIGHAMHNYENTLYYYNFFFFGCLRSQ